MKYHLHMWQPREFLFRKVFMQYLHTTISALALLLQKKSRVWEHRSTFSVQSLLHQTCACPWCVWRGHAKTAAGNSTGRFSSRPPPPVVVRCHRHFLRNKLLIQQTLLIYTVQYILYNTSRVRGKCKYQIWDGFHFYLRGRNQRWIGLETGSRVSSHHYCSLAMLEGVDCTYLVPNWILQCSHWIISCSPTDPPMSTSEFSCSPTGSASDWCSTNCLDWTFTLAFASISGLSRWSLRLCMKKKPRERFVLRLLGVNIFIIQKLLNIWSQKF